MPRLARKILFFRLRAREDGEFNHWCEIPTVCLRDELMCIQESITSSHTANLGPQDLIDLADRSLS